MCFSPDGFTAEPPLIRPDGDYRAIDWTDALHIEAAIEGVSPREILDGRVDPVFEAERIVHAERARKASERRLRRARMRGAALVYAGILGGLFGGIGAWWGGHDVLAAVLWAVGAVSCAATLFFAGDF